MAVEIQGNLRPCVSCKFYKVSYDPGFPHHCLQFGIKSRELPSMAVYRNTRTPCPVYERNPKIKPGPSASLE